MKTAVCPKQTELGCHDSRQAAIRGVRVIKKPLDFRLILDVDPSLPLLPTTCKDVQAIIHKPSQDRRISSRSSRQTITHPRWRLTGITYPRRNSVTGRWTSSNKTAGAKTGEFYHSIRAGVRASPSGARNKELRGETPMTPKATPDSGV